MSIFDLNESLCHIVCDFYLQIIMIEFKRRIVFENLDTNYSTKTILKLLKLAQSLESKFKTTKRATFRVCCGLR